MTLYEIDTEMMSALNGAVNEDGEIIDEELYAKFEALAMDKTAKVENIALWIKNLNADADAYAKEEQAFYERKKKAKNKAESLKKMLQFFLDGEKFKTTKCEISFRNTQSVELTFPESEVANHLPLMYQRIKVEADKVAIKEALKQGEILDGCALITKQSMTIK